MPRRIVRAKITLYSLDPDSGERKDLVTTEVDNIPIEGAQIDPRDEIVINLKIRFAAGEPFDTPEKLVQAMTRGEGLVYRDTPLPALGRRIQVDE